MWPLNAGQVYTTLQRLERDGLVESEDPEGDGPQKGYRLTEAGGDELDAWLRTPSDTWEPPRDELVIKVLVATRIPGVDVHEVIQTHRRHVVEAMQRYTRLKGDAATRTTSRWRSWSTPRSSASRRWSGGSTPPTPAWRAGRRPSPRPADDGAPGPARPGRSALRQGVRR